MFSAIKDIRAVFYFLYIILFSICGKEKVSERNLNKPKGSNNIEVVTQEHTQTKLFSGNSHGYYSFRIPSLIKTTIPII